MSLAAFKILDKLGLNPTLEAISEMAKGQIFQPKSIYSWQRRKQNLRKSRKP